MYKFRLLSVLFLFISLVGCNPDDDATNNNNPVQTDFSKNFGASASRDFIGQVVDASSNPISGVTIKIGNETAQTDANGVFKINGAQVYEHFAYITAKKMGYVDGSRSMIPTAGKNNVKIMLVSNASTATIHTGNTATVSLPSGTKVVFDGAFQTESGTAYSGDVSVSIYHLMSSDANITSLMPGMLYARGSDGMAKMLQTFGMLHVELTGSGGQKLQIATGHTAKITMKIDDSQLATAPSTIPLWHFDETNGYWKQEGAAVKTGNTYVGSVSHFSWWNCDVFTDTHCLTVTVVDESGNFIANAGVSLKVLSTNISSYVEYTNSGGQVSGLIPANEALTLRISDFCGNVVYTSEIGPFNADTTLAPIVMHNSSTVKTTKISGILTDCDGTVVTDGYMIIRNGNQTTFCATSDGSFEFSTLTCAASTGFELEGYDLANMHTTGRVNFAFTYPETHVGTIRACSATTEFIIYQIDNNPAIYYGSPITAGNANGFEIFTSNPTNQNGTNELFSLSGGFTHTFATGNYTSVEFQLETWTAPSSVYILHQTNNTVVYHVNKFGAVGEFVDITFEGNFIVSPTNIHSVRGVIHVIRDN
jgi:hypothetical protein